MFPPSWNFTVQEFLCLSYPSPFSYSLYLVTRSSGFPILNIIAHRSASFYSYYQHSSQSSDISSQEDETVCYMVCLRPLSALIMLLFYLKLFNNLLLLFRKSLVPFMLSIILWMTLVQHSSFLPTCLLSLTVLFPLLQRPPLLYLSPINLWIYFSA